MRRPAPRGALRPLLGVDIGATHVAAGVVDARGRVSAHSGSRLHESESPASVIGAAIDAAAQLVSPDHPPARIGVGVAAQVDPTGQRAWYGPNLGWEDVQVAKAFKDRFGCPVVVANDARAAARAEWRLGAGAGCDNLLTIVVGTGVGGGVVVDGRLLEGAAGACGEIGHTVLVAGGRPCHCPARGCLEAYVGGWAIAERARERVRSDGQAGQRLVEAAGDPEAITAKAVIEAAKAGDRLSSEVLRTTADYLASGVAGLVNAFNPSRVVLGGGVVEGWPTLVSEVSKRVRASCQPPAARAVRVVRATLGPDIVLVGAALAARERALGGARPSNTGRRSPGG